MWESRLGLWSPVDNRRVRAVQRAICGVGGSGRVQSGPVGGRSAWCRPGGLWVARSSPAPIWWRPVGGRGPRLYGQPGGGLRVAGGCSLADLVAVCAGRGRPWDRLGGGLRGAGSSLGPTWWRPVGTEAIAVLALLGRLWLPLPSSCGLRRGWTEIRLWQGPVAATDSTADLGKSFSRVNGTKKLPRSSTRRFRWRPARPAVQPLPRPARGLVSAWSGQGVAWSRRGLVKAWLGQGVAWSRSGLVNAWPGQGAAWSTRGPVNAWPGQPEPWSTLGPVYPRTASRAPFDPRLGGLARLSAWAPVRRLLGRLGARRLAPMRGPVSFRLAQVARPATCGLAGCGLVV